MFKKEEQIIQFISTVKGLDVLEDCIPKPAKNYIPKWFKNIPSDILGTVKECPSFPDYFSQGYVLPMWADVKLSHSLENGWKWETTTSKSQWEIHNNNQFIDHTTANFNGIDGQFVFKAVCPWRIITPPGWSVLQLPLFYHFNKEWSVMPGIIDTDVYSSINQQVLYHGDGSEIIINRGDPFVLYIPFKRSDKLKHSIRYQTEKDKEHFDIEDTNFSSRFVPKGTYREIQRKRDKNNK